MSRPKTLTSWKRQNYVIPDALIRAMNDVIKLYKGVIKTPLSRSFLVRRGIKLAVQEAKQKLAKAKQGELHAKKRKELL
jgi:ethanolamine utilization cobalamin adenosyltransferase